MALQGIATFPGVGRILNASFTLSHGITPSCCSLECVPQASMPAPIGILEFRFGTVRLSFPNCRVDSYSARLNSSGQIFSLCLYDRRWKWAYGKVSGQFNSNTPSDTSLPSGLGRVEREQRKTAQQLAALLLAQMGEKAFDIRDLPADQYPEVEWDCTNPAHALSELASRCGCRIVMHLNGVVGIHRQGVGKNLPKEFVMEGGIGLEPPEPPDAVKIVCGHTRYQIDLPLVPVGLDIDGEIKPIEDLSYRPAGGFLLEDPYSFRSLDPGPPHPDGGVNPDSPQELAKRTVWRWYSVYLPTGKPPFDLHEGILPPALPGPDGSTMFPITDIDQLLPLLNEQVKTHVVGGRTVYKPAMVHGEYFPDTPERADTPPRTEYRKQWRLIPDKGIVEFNDAVFRVLEPPLTGTYPAILYLRTSFHFRSRPDWSLIRYERRYPLPGAIGTGVEKIAKRDDIVYTVRANYSVGGKLLSLIDNMGGINDMVDYYANAEAAAIQPKAPIEATYAGIIPIDPDGAIEQVGWTVGLRGATTRASRSTEFSQAVPSFQERIAFERIRHTESLDIAEDIRRAKRAAERRPGGRVR